MMNKRERVIATLEHRQPDRIPYEVGFTYPAFQKMAQYYGDDDFHQKLGNCITGLNAGLSWEDGWREVRPNIWADEFGVEWDKSVDRDIGIVCNHMITPETIESYQFPDPGDPRRYANYANTVANRGEHFVLANLGFSLFERAWTLYGMENLLMDMAAEPDRAHRLLDRILEYNLEIVKNACSFGIDAMMFGDDWGSQYGILMGIDRWREFIMPRVREMYQTARQRGKFVIIHSCGKVDSLFPDLIDCGLNCFNPFQPEVIDVYEAKKQYAGRLAFFGGVSTQRLLPYGSVAEVRKQVKRLLDVVGNNGGLIAAPAHAIPGDAKPENIAAMMEVLRNQ